ncbi:MAG: hypothetical protein ACREPM_11265, partial [Gemmatimonadaceae bacterium]
MNRRLELGRAALELGAFLANPVEGVALRANAGILGLKGRGKQEEGSGRQEEGSGKREEGRGKYEV